MLQYSLLSLTILTSNLKFTSSKQLQHAKILISCTLVTAGDPRMWSREDVVDFLRWSEYEFDLPQFDLDMFQMNGKLLSLFLYKFKEITHFLRRG